VVKRTFFKKKLLQKAKKDGLDGQGLGPCGLVPAQVRINHFRKSVNGKLEGYRKSCAPHLFY